MEIVLFGILGIIVCLVVFAERSWYAAVKETASYAAYGLGLMPKTMVASKEYLVDNHKNFKLKALQTGRYANKGIVQGWKAGNETADDFWDPVIEKIKKDREEVDKKLKMFEKAGL